MATPGGGVGQNTITIHLDKKVFTNKTNMTLYLNKYNPDTKQDEPVQLTGQIKGSTLYVYTGGQNGLNSGRVISFVTDTGMTGTLTISPHEGNDTSTDEIFHFDEGHNNYDAVVTLNCQIDNNQKMTISGIKTWDDTGYENKRPKKITVNLMNGDTVVASKDVSPDETGTWKYEFKNVPVYNSDGEAIEYTVTEKPLKNYTAEVTDYDIKNVYTPSEITIPVKKVWNDADNKDEARPDKVTVRLYANGEPTKNVIMLSDRSKKAGHGPNESWAGCFKDVPVKDADGNVITYTVKEENVDRYKSEVSGNPADGFIITNIRTTSVSGTKIWDDKGYENKRPDSITVNLLANGSKVDSATVTAANDWKYSFDNLTKYDESGKSIAYAVNEDPVYSYTSEVEGYNIINTYRLTIPVEKVWEDGNNAEHSRPEKITVKLYYGEEEVRSSELTAADNWRTEFTDLDPKKTYELKEEPVNGYSTSVTGSSEEGFTVTNTLMTKVEGQKFWTGVGGDGPGTLIPSSITVHLVKNGEDFRKQVVSHTNNWEYVFGDLPAYENGAKVVYSVYEGTVLGFTPSYDENSYNIHNEYTPGYVSINVSKEWKDNDNQDGKRPDSVTIALVVDGKVSTEKTVTLSSDNNWRSVFTQLPTEVAGKTVNYSVTEIVEGTPLEGVYESAVKGSVTEGFVVTNSHTPETVTVAGEKTWNDEGNSDKRPGSITVNLLANGVTVDSVAVSEDQESGKWTYEFKDLPKYNNGTVISYTVSEESVANYTASYTAGTYNIVNTYNPSKEEEELPPTPPETEPPGPLGPTGPIVEPEGPEDIPTDEPGAGEGDGEIDADPAGDAEVVPDGEKGDTEAMGDVHAETESKGVQTGDVTDMYLWLTIFGAALVSAAAVAGTARRREEK